MDTDTDDITTNGFGNCITRDGQGFATANQPMANFKHTNVGNASARNQYAAAGQVQDSALTFQSSVSGTGDAIVGTFAPAITALVNGMLLRVRAPGANTVNNPTFKPAASLTAYPITKNNGQILAVGEYASGQDLMLSYDSGGPHWDLLNTAASGAIAAHTVLANTTGATALPSGHTTSEVLDLIDPTQGDVLYRGASAWSALAAGTAGQTLISNGAAANPQWANVAPVAGSVRNASMVRTTAAATATFTADEIICETALGGIVYRLSSYSQAINLGTTGAGGMDTGAAPVSGFVSLYAIVKADGTKNILACSTATSTATIYAGGNMPSGYVASALVGMWPTNGSSQFVAGTLIDRSVYISQTSTGITCDGSAKTIDLSAIVPPKTKTVSGWIDITKSAVTSITLDLATNAAVSVSGGQVSFRLDGASGDLYLRSPFSLFPVGTNQTILATGLNGATAAIEINMFTF